MPYKHIQKKIPVEFDRRVKLTEDDRKQIMMMYHREKLPIREIARVFEGKCSRRLIQFVLFPERLESHKKRAKEEKRHLKYYNKDKWRETQKSHRHYKQKLYLKKKLV